jgi:hypothetical protein
MDLIREFLYEALLADAEKRINTEDTGEKTPTAEDAKDAEK